MVARKIVSVNWQTLFVFIPFVDLWAVYRIEKLRWYILIFAIGFGITQFSLAFVIDDSTLFVTQDDMIHFDHNSKFDELFISDFFVMLIIIEIIEFATRVYFIRRWSKEWNFRVRGYFAD